MSPEPILPLDTYPAKKREQIWIGLMDDLQYLVEIYEPIYLGEGQATKLQNAPFTRERYQAFERWLGDFIQTPVIPPHIKRSPAKIADDIREIVDLYEQIQVLTKENRVPVDIVNRYGEAKNVIQVPDLSAAELLQAFQAQSGVSELGEECRGWDFYRTRDGRPLSGRGKRFEVVTTASIYGKDPAESEAPVTSEEIRAYFNENGFYGHTAAFLAWIMARGPQGGCVSILEDDACDTDTRHNLYVPVWQNETTVEGKNKPSLGLTPIDLAWRGAWTFVAFREIRFSPNTPRRAASSPAQK